MTFSKPLYGFFITSTIAYLTFAYLTIFEYPLFKHYPTKVFFSFSNPGFKLKQFSYLIIIHIVSHNDRLNGYQNLHQIGGCCGSIFVDISPPSSEQWKANISICIQIRVESDRALACCHQINFWRNVWILVFTVNIEQKDSVCVGGFVASHDDTSNHIWFRDILSNKHRVCVVNGKLLCHHFYLVVNTGCFDWKLLGSFCWINLGYPMKF